MTNIKVRETSQGWWIKEPRFSINRPVTECFPKDGRWQFNGNYECPTFTPSLNCSWGGGETEIPFHRNHFIVTNGMISYCSDCTHELKGQTLELICFTEQEMMAPGTINKVSE